LLLTRPNGWQLAHGSSGVGAGVTRGDGSGGRAAQSAANCDVHVPPASQKKSLATQSRRKSKQLAAQQRHHRGLFTAPKSSVPSARPHDSRTHSAGRIGDTSDGVGGTVGTGVGGVASGTDGGETRIAVGQRASTCPPAVLDAEQSLPVQPALHWQRPNTMSHEPALEHRFAQNATSLAEHVASSNEPVTKSANACDVAAAKLIACTVTRHVCPTSSSEPGTVACSRLLARSATPP